MDGGIILARGAIFEIRSFDDVVWCEVVNRSEVSPEEGARCARLMHEVLTTKVLVPQSAYRALVFDVRQGPQAFGPKTRAELVLIFAAANTAQRRLAVLVSSSATQRMQFGNLSLEHAPDHSRVFQTETSARVWLDSPV